jgi:hypothetical protein
MTKDDGRRSLSGMLIRRRTDTKIGRVSFDRPRSLG